MATEDTRLIYVTTGVLLQKIVSAKSLMEFTHIFIDEVSTLRPVLLPVLVSFFLPACLPLAF